MADDAGGKEFELVGRNVMGAGLEQTGPDDTERGARGKNCLFWPMPQKWKTSNLAAAGVQGAELKTGPDEDAK